MITKKMQQLEAAKAKIANLENAIAAELNKELASLPGKFGFGDVKSFLKAVKSAAGGKRRGKAAKAGKKSAGGKKRRTRAVITDATRAEVKKLVEAGKTGGQIAKTVGISLPSVQNIKKALGLVKKR
jgi:DNA-binding NarL/FixJ family response regulator